jgi:hypothetical protein
MALLSITQVASYTHYPTVSSDMISKVWTRRADFNNDDSVASELRWMMRVQQGWVNASRQYMHNML